MFETIQKLTFIIPLSPIISRASAVALLPKLMAMSVLFQVEPLFFFIRHGSLIGAFSPWVAEVLLLKFGLVFYLIPGSPMVRF